MAELRDLQFTHVVPVIRNDKGWTSPKFSDCVMDSLNRGKKFVEVMCCLKDDLLMITPVKDSKYLNNPDDSSEKSEKFGPLFLEHSCLCPMKEVASGDYPDVTFPEKRLHVAVAVAVVLESADSHVLLTQRASTMRSYPGIWVPPGGHLDKGETILECGLRELEEETGLKFAPSEIKSNYLCMWEGVAPPILTLGNPKSHSIVVYIHVQAPYTWEEMQQKIKIDQTEVQSWCWYTRNTIQQLQASIDEKISMYKAGDTPGKHEEVQTSLTAMFRTPYLWSQGLFYSGTHQALVLWSRKTSKL